MFRTRVHHTVTPARHTLLMASDPETFTQLRVVRPSAKNSNQLREFVSAFAAGLAELSDEDFGEERLTLPLGVSAWMRQSRVEMSGASDAMLALRSAILETSGLDASSEPVPLAMRDRATNLLSLATYIYHLVNRASLRSQTSRSEVVGRALSAMEPRWCASAG